MRFTAARRDLLWVNVIQAQGRKVSTRQERQQEKTRLKKKLRNPIVRRLLKNELERGGSGTEVYRLDDDGTGKPMFFDIYSMRNWADQNCETFALPVDFNRAARLVASGAVEPDHIRDHTIRTELKPIIVCTGLLDGDQIVDGAHRYVAMCAGAAMFQLNPPVPAYVLHPDEWKPFVIPTSVAKVCGFT